MTYEEVKNGIVAAMAKPETMETAMLPILDELKADYEGFESTSQTLEKAQVKIRDLQDTNHKLFLAQVGSPKNDPEDAEKPTGAGVFDEFLGLVNKEEDK